MVDSMNELLQNFYNSLTPILPFLEYLGLNVRLSAVVFLAKMAISLIKMKKDNINKKIAYISPELLERCKSIDDSKLLEPYKERVLEFYNILKEHFDDEVLERFLNNIETLKIDKSKFVNIFKRCAGLYYIDENLIFLNSNRNSVLVHELLHMASTIITRNYIMCGFEYNEDENFHGMGLNEGYTEILNRRYFYKDSTSVQLYEYFVKVMNSMEMIVGKDNMEKCYFKYGLPGLCRHLKNYLSDEDINAFIENTDFLYSTILEKHEVKNPIQDPKKIQSAFETVNHLLTNGYIKKTIDSGEFNKESLENFTSKLPYEYISVLKWHRFQEDVNNYVVEGEKTL